MEPPYTLSPKMLNLCSEINRLLGQYDGVHLSKPEPKLRKANRVRTIQASLAIEGNTLDLDQVTAILDGKKVLGPKRDILEVQNAVRAYEQIQKFKPTSSKSLRRAHEILMMDLIPDAGKWRHTNVGIFQGSKVAHTAPQAKRVPELMEQLFNFLKAKAETHPLIVSAIFHYELEFIHPFSDGNGRIGRLWQSVLLSKYHALFEFTPIETVIRERQSEYYNSLGASDKKGEATPFIEFSLTIIHEALESLQSTIRPPPLSAGARLEIACEKFAGDAFNRKAYLLIFKSISTATASRDLAFGVEHGIIEKTGEQALAK
jgi:Fic family protein